VLKWGACEKTKKENEDVRKKKKLGWLLHTNVHYQASKRGENSGINTFTCKPGGGGKRRKTPGVNRRGGKSFESIPSPINWGGGRG